MSHLRFERLPAQSHLLAAVDADDVSARRRVVLEYLRQSAIELGCALQAVHPRDGAVGQHHRGGGDGERVAAAELDAVHVRFVVVIEDRRRRAVVGGVVAVEASERHRQHLQQVGRPQRELLAAAAADTRWLLVLDDVWAAEHERQLNFVDPSAAPQSKVFVTTRFAKLLPGYVEVALGLLDGAEAVALLLGTAEVSAPAAPQVVASTIRPGT